MISFENVSYHYPFQPRAAVRNISLRVAPGELALLTGASGCGKSTIVRLANGLIPHFLEGSCDGAVRIAGHAVNEMSLAEIGRHVGTLFQDPEQQFFCADVYSELAFAHELRGAAAATTRATVANYAANFELTPVLDASIFTLSEGEKQKLALAAALSLEPRCLVLDEPTANLSPAATTALARMLAELKNRGFAILVADHRLYWLADVADTVMIMDDGEIRESGSFALLEKPGVCARYGLRTPRLAPGVVPDADRGNGAIAVRDMTVQFSSGRRLFSGASFDFSYGCVTALTGANGAGKTTLARVIAGLHKPRQGRISFNHIPLSHTHRLRRVALVMQNTDHQLYARTVRDEVMLSSPAGRGDHAEKLLETVGLEACAGRHPHSLSGGEKQRLVIAAALAKKSDVLILDEPTSGLDGKNMSLIRGLLHDCARNGACVIVITHDLEFLHSTATAQVAL